MEMILSSSLGRRLISMLIKSNVVLWCESLSFAQYKISKISLLIAVVLLYMGTAIHSTYLVFVHSFDGSEYLYPWIITPIYNGCVIYNKK